MASQAIYLVDFLMGGRNFKSQVYCLASPVYRLLRERSVESGYMPRNFSELGGTIPILSPTLKSGGTRPPCPPLIDARDYIDLVEIYLSSQPERKQRNTTKRGALNCTIHKRVRIQQ